MPPPPTPRNRNPQRTSTSSSDSDPQSQRGIHLAETAAGAGSTGSVQQAGQGQAGQGQAGQGQAVLPSSAVRETKSRSHDPHPSRAERAQAAAGPPAHVGEVAVRAYDSAAARARQAQAATPEPSVAALSWRLRAMEIGDGPTLWRGAQREHHAPGVGVQQASGPGAGGRGTLSPPTETTHPQDGTAAKLPRSRNRILSAEAVAAGGGGTPPPPPPVDSTARDGRVYTAEARAMVLKLLSEGKTVIDIARITGIMIKTI